MTKQTRIGIVGATGYTGAELVRILSEHPAAEVALVTSTRRAGTAVGELYPALSASGLEYEELDPADAKERCGGFFVCAPHGVAMDVVPDLLDDNHWVIDLSADFRLADTEVYEAWYGVEHSSPVLLAEAAYGLPELFADDVAGARLVANPGCYPTASVLALAPAVAAGLVEPGSIVIDAMSGVSGAGREPAEATMFSECAESVSAYKVACHRHTPEIEEVIGRVAGSPNAITFTPHLAPMVRGLLATCTATLTKDLDTAGALAVYADSYAKAPFVSVMGEGVMPATKHVTGSNACHIGVAVDERTGRLVVVSAIDNLMKGASGQAVQNMNIMLGLDETTGLTSVGRVV